MQTAEDPKFIPTIVLPLSGGGHKQIAVTPNVYGRYQALRQRGILSKEDLLRLATFDGTREATTENVTQAVFLPGHLIRERIAQLDAIAGGSARQESS